MVEMWKIITAFVLNGFIAPQADVVFIMLCLIDIYSVFGYTWRVQVSELRRKRQIVSAGD